VFSLSSIDQVQFCLHASLGCDLSCFFGSSSLLSGQLSVKSFLHFTLSCSDLKLNSGHPSFELTLVSLGGLDECLSSIELGLSGIS
jgi:hypothetical protein